MSRHRCHPRRVWMAAWLAAVAGLWLGASALAQPAAPEELEPEPPRAEPVKRLRLMLLDLADLRVPEEAPTFDAPSGGFRHTFGSQRRTSEESEPIVVYPEALEADIVLLGGLGNMSAARRLFPARDWRLLQARTSPADKAHAVPGPPPMAMPRKQVPGVAMWLQPGVRFAGTDPGLPPGVGAVLRMHSGLGVLWALSPSAPCPAATARDVASGGVCPALEGWIGARSAAGDIAVVGGLLPTPHGPPPKPAGPVSTPPRTAPAGALPLALRRHEGRLVLTGADVREHCAPTADAWPALVVATAKAKLDQLQAAGYVLPLKRPQPPAGPASRAAPPTPPPACVLLLDVVLP